MSQTARCPECKNGKLLYVMRSVERHSMDGLPDEDGYVDLFALEESTPDDTFIPYIECVSCPKRFNLNMTELI